jgi:predicted dehydrogenase/RimJ/RimL family protein N-acetyltransferase
VAVIGQGSIGRRHAAILLEMGQQVVVYDIADSAAPPPGVRRAANRASALSGADAAVIASPSSEHVHDAAAAIELGVPVLVEKPLATDAVLAAELDCLARARGVLLSVAQSMREHAGVRAVAAELETGSLGRVLRAAAWCGSWLPGWRPDSDYRASYSASAVLGGGVLLDVAVHELDYLLWLLGPAVSVTALARRVSDLQIDVEDVAVILLELRDGAIAEVVVDYFDHSYHRGVRIVGSTGTLEWNWEAGCISRRDASGRQSQSDVDSDVEPAYRRQMERFLAAVRGEAPVAVTADAARHVLEVIDAARTSSARGRRVALAPGLRLREARTDDGDRLRAWRNDPATRLWSRTQHEIGAEEHRAWLLRALASASTRLWIAESDGDAVGQVRMTADGDGTMEVHLGLAAEARGRGLAAPMLREAAGRVLAEPGVERLVANVKPDNEPSLKAFLRAGFVRGDGDGDGWLRLERRPAT